jgi:hypothetical protein
VTPAEHREGRAWTRADVIHLANTLPLILEDVEEGEAGYGDLEAVILRAFADVGHPLVPADDKRVTATELREVAQQVHDELAAKYAERERILVKALEKYGNHLSNCPRVTLRPGGCECGFNAALDSVQEGERS